MKLQLTAISTLSSIKEIFEYEYNEDIANDIITQLEAEIKDNNLIEFNTYNFLIEFCNDNLDSVIFVNDAFDVNADSITFDHLNGIAIIDHDEYRAHAFRLNIQ
jgi:hypothetical protein